MSSAAEGRHRAAPSAPASAPLSAPGSVALSPAVELLLEAIAGIGADLDVGGVMDRTLQAACLVTEASYGVISVDSVDRVDRGLGPGVDRAVVYGQLRAGSAASASRGGLRLPIVAGGTTYGRLHLVERRDGGPFTALDELIVTRLLAAAGQAIVNATTHQETARRLAVLEHDRLGDLAAERERIARDLHDLVIQRLYAAGMQLQAVRRTGSVDPARVGAAVEATVRDLDTTIRDLRAVVYELRRSRSRSMLAEVRALLQEYGAPLGFAPALRFSGPVDAVLDGEVGDHVLATLREVLSNVAKHARASAAQVELHVSTAWAMLRVSDDGVGMAPAAAGVLGSGLGNLRARADGLGGVMRIGAATPHGTCVEWLVPVGR
jgi:signal transduction histidine kinase